MNVRWMGTGYYSKGRQGRSVGAIVPHISCCSSIAGIDNTFGPYSSRKVSTHYAVSETEVHQYVHEYDTAWAVGNWEGNLRTISIEHVGTTDRPPTRECLDMGARIMADVARRLGWSRLALGLNVTLHKWYAATACPANMDVEWEVERANLHLAKLWGDDAEEEARREAERRAREDAQRRAAEEAERRRVEAVKSVTRRHGMEMLFYVKGEHGTRYMCGGYQRMLGKPEEQAAVEAAYRKCYGMEIPHVTLEADVGRALLDAIESE